MKKFNKNKLKPALLMVLFSIAIFMVLIGAASQFTEMEKLKTQLASIGAEMWVGLLFLGLVNFFFRGYRWHFLANTLNLNIPFKKMALYYACGFALVTTPGKIGTALRMWLIKKHHNIDLAKTAPIMLMDQLTDLIALMLFALIGLFAFKYIGISLFLAGGFLCGVILLLYKPKLILFILDKMSSLLNKPKFFESLKDIIITTKALLSPYVFSTTTLFAGIGWAASIYSFYILIQHLGGEINLLTATFIYTSAIILGTLSMMPGGLGTGEVIMVGLLIGVGVPNDVAIISTAVIRLVTLWFAVVIGFIFLPFGLKTAKKIT